MANVGTQSLAVTIRVLMDENISGKQKLQFVLKEMRVGGANGFFAWHNDVCMCRLLSALCKGLDYGYSFTVAGCVGLALFLAMIISSLIGTIILMFSTRSKSIRRLLRVR